MVTRDTRVMTFAVRIHRLFATLVFGFLLLSGLSASFAQTRLDGVVVSDHDAAIRAGVGILEQGGNAVDAAVATAFALAVVEPASSGLGGGGVMVIYQLKEKKAHALDFTEVSPAAASPGLYRKEDGVRQDLLEAGALAVAVPGTVAGLTEALKRFGSLPLETVLVPAIRHAAAGFPVTRRLRRVIEENLPALRQRANFSRIFLTASGAPHDVGEMIRQPELAETLKTIAREGAAGFYEGAVGQAIAARIKNVTLDDLNSYKPVWRRPLIGSYRERKVITVPPPSVGGVALVGLLNVMEGYGPDQFRHNSGAYLHLVAETTKAGTADLLEHLGDPDSNEIPVQRITSRERASAVRKQISMDVAARRNAALPTAPPGEKSGLSHVGVLDGDGNAVSMCLAIGSPFGAKMLVRETGVILNNQMRKFSLTGGPEGSAGNARNMLKPRTRPVNGLTPAILLRDDRPVLIIGASGGPETALQTVLNVLDFRMPLTEAVAAARIHVPAEMPQVVEVEQAVSDDAVVALEGKGHTVRRRQHLGTVQAIRVEGKSITGVSDPRGTGAAP